MLFAVLKTQEYFKILWQESLVKMRQNENLKQTESCALKICSLHTAFSKFLFIIPFSSVSSKALLSNLQNSFFKGWHWRIWSTQLCIWIEEGIGFFITYTSA